MNLPRVDIIALGGTIAMAGASAAGVLPTLTAEDLVGAVPQLAEVAQVRAIQFRMIAGSSLTMGDLVATAGLVRQRLAGMHSEDPLRSWRAWPRPCRSCWPRARAAVRACGASTASPARRVTSWPGASSPPGR